MALTPRLDLRQSQTLVMTPRLQQAIRLLQMSSLELAAFVDTEIDENPLLERDETAPSADSEPVDEPALDTQAAPELKDSLDFAEADTVPAVADEPLDTDYENLWAGDESGRPFDPGGPGRSPGRGNEFDDQAANLEQTAGQPPTLRQHLLQQLGVDITDPVDRVIGLHLIDMLDDRGWLDGDLGSVARLLNCEEARVASTLRRLQHFDPPGVFARDLGECLALQLSERDRLDPAMQALLGNLDLLARRDVERLRRLCGVDADDIADMMAEIKRLNPKPANLFEPAVVQAITPDLLMRPSPDGGWRVELNPEALPRVLVNRRYYAEVSRTARSRKDKAYIDERLEQANWLMRSLHQRANTIVKVASEIVRRQDAFFRHGVRDLKPLVLREVAEAIEMHESTISRVTSNKYMATPRGVYELKYFFSSAIASAGGGDAHSAEAVRFRIKALIDAEAPDRVLSDDRIVDILRADGIDIARRTVAKYREAMRIPASVRRRYQKAIGR
ncbi:MAG: RNA polymerase factor sigma-54 [Kiloniellales bacterium]